MTRTLAAPAVYARPDLCPQCWSRLYGTLCTHCGLNLDVPQAWELFQLSCLVDAWLDRRGRALAALRDGVDRTTGLPPLQLAPRTDAVPVVYARPDLCPQCWTPLHDAGCPACGLRLAGPWAPTVLEAGRQVDGWLAVRGELITRLQAGNGPQPTPAPQVAQPAQAPQRQPVGQPRVEIPHAPLPQEAEAGGGPLPPPPEPPAPPRPARPPWWSRVTPQALLLGLGALLVGVAAVIFLVVTWDRLDSDGRALVLAGTTVLTGAISWGTRRRLPETAEAFGGLTVLLVALDVVALRITGMLAPTLAWDVYLAAAATVVGLGYLALAKVIGLRAFRYGAALLLPLSPALTGRALSAHAPLGEGAAAFVLGLGGAVALLVGAAALGRREGLAVPAAIGYATALAVQPLTVWGLLAAVSRDVTWAGALALALAAAAAGHALLARFARGVFSVLAGVLAACGLALPIIDHLDVWWLLFVPVMIGLLTLALVRPTAVSWRGFSSGRAAAGAAGVLAVAVLPGAVVTLLRSSSALAAWTTPWQFRPGQRWGLVADGLSAINLDVAVAGLAGCLTGALVLHLWGLRTGRSTRDAAAVTLGVIGVSLPWWHQLPIAVVVPAGVLVTVGLLLAARRPALAASGAGVLLQTTGCALSVLTVIAAWTSEPLAVPTTLIGTAGLLFWWSRTRRPLLWVPVSASLYAAALGLAVSADLLAVQIGFPLVWVALALTVVVVVLPTRWLAAADRQVLGLCAAVPGGIALAGQLVALVDGQVPGGPMLMTWTCLAALACAVAFALDPRDHLPVLARHVAVPVGVFFAVAAALSANAWWLWPDEALAAALPLLVGAALVRLLWARGAGADIRLRILEVSLAVAATIVLSLAPSQTQAWPALLVLAAGCAIVASLPERREAGWAAWALLTVAWWDLPLVDGLRVVEVWTVPPALVLLAVGAWAAWREGRVLRPSLLAGGFLLVLPSAAASVNGASWRAPLVLIVGLLLVTAVAVLRRSGSRAVQELAAGYAPALGLALLLGPWLRGLTDLPAGPGADLLVVGAAAGLGALGAGRWLWPTSWNVSAALTVGVLPLLLRPGVGDDSLVRTWVCIAVTGGLLAGAQWLRLRGPARGQLVLIGVAGALLGVSVVAGALTQLARSDGAALDLVTAPAALALLVFGALRMLAGQDGSWRVVGPASLLALGPSLLISLGGGSSLRLVLLTVGCALAVVVGLRLQWLAPIVVGAGLLIVHGVVQLAPWFVQVYATVPRWAHLAVVGAVLLMLGARYEHRLADVRSMRRMLRELR